MQATVQNFDPDVICITETWLNPQLNNANLGLSNFCIFRRDRPTREGGILIAIKANLNPVLIESNHMHEVLVVRATIDSLRVNFILTYRPPGYSASDNQALVEFLDQKINQLDNIYLLGDFNYPHINWSNSTASTPEEAAFLNFCTSNSLSQFVNEPTRDENILDLVLTFDLLEPLQVNVLENFSNSDHNIVEILISNRRQTSTPKIIYDYKSAHWDLIFAHLACITWENGFFYNSNVSSMWEQFKNLLLFLIETYVPKKILMPQKSAPWFNNTLKKLSRKKKSLYNRQRRTQSPRVKTEYKEICLFYPCIC